MGPRCSEVEIKLAYKSAQVQFSEKPFPYLCSFFFFFLGLHTESEGQTAGEAPEIISDDQRKGEQAIYTVLPRVGTVADHSQLRRKPLTGQIRIIECVTENINY